MASIMQRISLIFRAKANTALDKREDPREVLDYSYTKQQELLAKVRRGVADVATSRKRIELQINQLDQSAQKLQGQAQQALAAGREDLAREALTRKAGLQQQIADLQAQQAQQQYAPPPPQYAPPPPAAAPAAAGSDDMVAQLENLKKLLDQGILTQAEFDMQKQKLLAGA